MTVETKVGERGTERDVSNAVIDSDGHVQEQLTLPPDLMVEIMQRIGADFEAMTTAGAEDPFPMEGSGPPTLQTIAGGWDPLARLVDMDADGIDIAVLYPTTPGLVVRARRRVLQRDVPSAYNSWLQRVLLRPRRRASSASGLVPLQDPRAAVNEMERCVQELGFKAVMIRPAPYIENKKLNDPVYDPFWDAAASARLPDRRPPVLVRRHAERRDPARASTTTPSATRARDSRSVRDSATRST